MPIITYYFEFAGGRPRATLNPIRVHRILSNNDMPAMSVSCGSNICAPPLFIYKNRARTNNFIRGNRKTFLFKKIKTPVE